MSSSLVIVCPRWREAGPLVELLVQFGDAVSPVEPPELYWGALRFVLCPLPDHVAPWLPTELTHAAYGLYLDGRMLVEWEQHALDAAPRSALEAALEAFAQLAPCAVVYENEGSSVGSKFIAAKAGSLFSQVDEAIGRVALVGAAVSNAN